MKLLYLLLTFVVRCILGSLLILVLALFTLAAVGYEN
jgi:hypothetical protein